ncbi:hypothetical protein GCM10010430_52560 [Kitasatospora cystarginea]|uniref:Uncharacterized protein n=1 Tax=Kitasatospora cystarginea TaxID=58350 RepID=A0ABN3EKQ2_9ACTN
MDVPSYPRSLKTSTVTASSDSTVYVVRVVFSAMGTSILAAPGARQPGVETSGWPRQRPPVISAPFPANTGFRPKIGQNSAKANSRTTPTRNREPRGFQGGRIDSPFTADDPGGVVTATGGGAPQ